MLTNRTQIAKLEKEIEKLRKENSELISKHLSVYQDVIEVCKLIEDAQRVNVKYDRDTILFRHRRMSNALDILVELYLNLLFTN